MHSLQDIHKDSIRPVVGLKKYPVVSGAVLIQLLTIEFKVDFCYVNKSLVFAIIR